MSKNKKLSLKRASRLFQYIKPYRVEFSFGLFFLLLSTAASLIFPALMGQLVDSASNKLISNINEIAIALLVLFALQAIFSYFRIVLYAIRFDPIFEIPNLTQRCEIPTLA